MWGKPDGKVSEGSNLRWEGSRMMITEHVKAIRQREFEKTKVEKPTLDDQEWEIIGQKLQLAIHSGDPITITYYKDGFIEEIAGSVMFFDNQLKRIKIEKNEWDIDWLWIKDILAVK